MYFLMFHKNPSIDLWDEDKHLQIWGNGPQSEKGGHTIQVGVQVLPKAEDF